MPKINGLKIMANSQNFSVAKILSVIQCLFEFKFSVFFRIPFIFVSCLTAGLTEGRRILQRFHGLAHHESAFRRCRVIKQ